MRKLAILLAGCALGAATAPAMAADFVVDAYNNSSSGGSAVNTGMNFTAGSFFDVFVSLDDLWSAGALPRWSDANGLDGDLFATGSDESGELAGTQIGASFGLHNQDGFSAPFGALVGRINGQYQILGTSFSGPAWATGTLELMYWDSNFGDNEGRITASVNPAVPEPASWALMIGGLGLVGATLRRRAAVRFA